MKKKSWKYIEINETFINEKIYYLRKSNFKKLQIFKNLAALTLGTHWSTKKGKMHNTNLFPFLLLVFFIFVSKAVSAFFLLSFLFGNEFLYPPHINRHKYTKKLWRGIFGLWNVDRIHGYISYKYVHIISINISTGFLIPTWMELRKEMTRWGQICIPSD